METKALIYHPMNPILNSNLQTTTRKKDNAVQTWNQEQHQVGDLRKDRPTLRISHKTQTSTVEIG